MDNIYNVHLQNIFIVSNSLKKNINIQGIYVRDATNLNMLNITL